MAKKIDAAVSMAGSFNTTAQLLDAAVKKRGGNLAEALALLAKPAYASAVDKLADILAAVRAADIPETSPLIESWVAFYGKHFPQELAAAGGIEALRAVAVPAPPALTGYRLSVVLAGLAMNAAYTACAKRFTCWRCAGDLDRAIPTNDRMPAASYAVWVRDRIEADEEFANQSANDLAAKMHKGITLLERIILELAYFEEKGSHLDVSNVTLCSGSRGADGYVPFAYWRGGEFRVYWNGTSYRRPYLRSREVFR